MLRRFLITASIVTIGAIAAGCGGGSGDVATADGGTLAAAEAKGRRSSTPTTITPAPAPTVPVTAVPTGRLLASNCFQCHGTNGKSAGGFDSLAGETVSEIASELKELQLKTDADKAIMRVHALGYTDAQIQALATYFASIPR